MRDPREAVEADVVAPRAARELAHRSAAKLRGLLELAREAPDGAARSLEQERNPLVARRLGPARLGVGFTARFRAVAVAPLLDFAEAVLERFDQRRAPLGMREKVVLG